MPEVIMKVDSDDGRDINAAIAFHQANFRFDGEHLIDIGKSDIRGATLAEICRSWLAHLQQIKRDRGQ